jgi:hypothetical protein
MLGVVALGIVSSVTVPEIVVLDNDVPGIDPVADIAQLFVPSALCGTLTVFEIATVPLQYEIEISFVAV